MLGFLPVFAVLPLGRPRTGLTEGSFPNPNSALACSNSSIRRLISAVRDASDTVDKSTSVICPPSKSFCINTAKALYAQVRRSEERRVGKECRCDMWGEHSNE